MPIRIPPRGILVSGFVALAAIGHACRSSTEVDGLAGRLPLMSYNGAAIPVVIGPLPPTGLDSSVSHCNVLATTGTLELRRDRTYSLSVERRNSCTMDYLGLDTERGTFTVSGDSLSLSVQGTASPLSGRFDATSVTVLVPPATLRFKR